MRYSYSIVDVFTQQEFQGNPLAIIHDTRDLLDTQMQTVAREFNFHTTVFVCYPSSQYETPEIRVFTPNRELPFAAQPAIAVSVVLGLKKKLSAIRFDQKIGRIVSTVEKTSKTSGHACFSLPVLPHFMEATTNATDIAEVFNINPEEIGALGAQPATYGVGIKFIVVPIRDIVALRCMKFSKDRWSEIFPEGTLIYAFTPIKDHPKAQIAARAFIDLGNGNIVEDNAAGVGAAALSGFLADIKYGDEGLNKFTIIQGEDTDRPGYLEMQYKLDDGQLTHAGIGGHAVVVADGFLTICTTL